MSLSIPDIGFGLAAELDIGDVENGDEKEQALKQAWRRWTMPRILTVPFQIPAAAAGTYATRVGEGPVDQRQWTLKRLCFDLATSVGVAEPAGITVFLYSDTTGLSHISPLQLPSTDLRWKWTSLPVLQAWTDEQQVIFGPEDFVLVVNSTATFVQLSGQAQIVDEPQYVLDFETWLNTIRE